jgi:hypothetical protein
MQPAARASALGQRDAAEAAAGLDSTGMAICKAHAIVFCWVFTIIHSGERITSGTVWAAFEHYNRTRHDTRWILGLDQARELLSS